MSKCVNPRPNVVKDPTERLNKAVANAAAGNKQKAEILTGYFDNPLFIQYVNEQYKQDTAKNKGNLSEADIMLLNKTKVNEVITQDKINIILKINSQRIGIYLNDYYKKQHKRIDNSAALEAFGIVDGFASIQAVSVAKAHTVELTLDKYFEELTKPIGQRLNRLGVVNEVVNKIKQTFRSDYAIPLLKELEVRDPKLHKAIIDVMKPIRDAFAAAQTAYDSSKLAYVNAYKTYRTNATEENKKALDEAKTAFNKAKEVHEDNESKYFTAYVNFVRNNATDVRQKNYAALAAKVQGNREEWFTATFNIGKYSSLGKVFNGVFDNQGEDYGTYDDADNINLDSDPDVDSYTSIYSDDLTKYKDFMQSIDNEVKLRISRLYNLTTTNSSNGVYSYDFNNELGVRTTMGANFVVAAISNATINGSVDIFGSPKDFIDGIIKLANSNKSYYGLIQLANDMIASPELTNQMMNNFARYKAKKVRVNITNEGIELKQSNRAVEPLSFLMDEMVNVARSELAINNAGEQSEIVSKYLGFLNQQTKDVSTWKDTRTEIDKLVTDILLKYFPKVITEQAIHDYLYSNEGDTWTKYTQFLGALQVFLKTADKVVIAQSEAKAVQSRRYRAWIKLRDEAMNGNIVNFNEEEPVLNDISDIDENLQASLIEIARALVNYVVIKNELNSVNAEGNLGSDMLDNSFISTIIKQIHYGTQEQSDMGLRLLLKHIQQSPIEYGNNPLFYGIYNEKGQEVHPGLFVMKNGIYVPRDNAKYLLDVYLFNGIGEEASNNNVIYSGMSKDDYFMTELLNYYKPVRTSSKLDDAFNIGSYFMRTPSDASKAFMINAPKISIAGLFQNNSGSQRSYIATQFDKIYKMGITDEVPASLPKNFRPGATNYKSNVVSAEELYDLIKRNPEALTYNRYYSIEKDGKVAIPFIYKGKNETALVVLVEGERLKKEDENKFDASTDKIATKTKITAIYTTVTDGATNVPAIPSSFAEELGTTLINEGLESGEIKTIVNTKHTLFKGFYKHLHTELNVFVDNLNNVFVKDESGNYVAKSDTTNLFKRFHYNDTIVADGRLTGNVFKFTKFRKVKGVNLEAEMEEKLLLYGGVGSGSLFQVHEDGNISLNLDRTDLIKIESDGTISLNIGESVTNELNSMISNWLTAYSKDIIKRSQKYKNVIDGVYNFRQVQEAQLNYGLMYMNFDALFDGDAKFYANPKDAMKRAKQTQAGGKAFANYDLSQDMYPGLQQTRDYNGKEITITIPGLSNFRVARRINGNTQVDQVMTARNGFRAVTIADTITVSKNAENIFNQLKTAIFNQITRDKTLTPEEERRLRAQADNQAALIARGYGYNDGSDSAVNDGQSWITIEEFISRRQADGTLHQYTELLRQLLDPAISIDKIDIKAVNARIQIQKNFYYDKPFDKTTRTSHPRQIKNAELVLIPKLIEGTDLARLYEIMHNNDIGQVNTAKASKSATRNVITFWDNDGNVVDNGNAFEAAIMSDVPVETYYYRYLYKQLDMADHMKDANNKVAIMFIKKMLDNSKTASPEVRAYAETIMDMYVANIKESHINLMDRMGWELDETGNPVNKENPDKPLDFTEFYKLAREEMQRTGIDSNMMDYLTTTTNGQTVMPTFMNLVSVKIENIAQSIYNRNIVRQTLPGWHAAQTTAVGWSKDLKYHPAVEDENGNIVQKAYAEVLLPRWSKFIPKNYTIAELEEAGIDLHLGYRVPTEGKQSTIILKVVGFLDDSMGSSIVVPDDWVTQTGSDFDIDTVYGISFELERNIDGKVRKVPYDGDTSLEATQRRWETYKVIDDYRGNMSFEEFSRLSIAEQNTRKARNNKLLEAMIGILEDPSSLEESYARSNFDDVVDAMHRVDAMREAQNVLSGEDNSVSYSPYDGLDQVEFMGNAVDGLQLKAFSVSRDTFNSLGNFMEAYLAEGYEVLIDYDSTKYNLENLKSSYPDSISIDDATKTVRITHNRLANSANNRNVAFQIITAYSSQTTAHILDAVKEGTVFNENKYTFGTIKTLIDLGTDYYTAFLFIQQSAISRIVNAFFETNSIYLSRKGNPVQKALNGLAVELGILIDGAPINEWTSTTLILKALSQDPRVQNGFVNLFGAAPDLNNIDNASIFALNVRNMENRYNYPKTYNTVWNVSDEEKNKQLAFDIATILSFQRLHNITQTIENLVQVSNPDKFGAKQTIRRTDKTIDTIKEYITNHKTEVYKTVKVGNKSFLEALFPGIEEGKIRVDESAYRYLAAFMQYATMFSVKANKQLLTMENEQYNEIVKAVESMLNISFTDEQYKEYKMAMVNYVYSSVGLFTTPFTIDDTGHFIPDETKVKENAKVDTKFWNNERARVFGYNSTESINLVIEDINNPTAEEISKFADLTPAQKVIWLQNAFTEDPSIFGYMRPNMFNQRQAKLKGVNTQNIRYSDQIDDSEILYAAFTSSFFNKNPLVKLAALDLVKYGFLVEGFKFKKGAISKTIPNGVLLADNKDFGLDITAKIISNLAVHADINGTQTAQFIDRYVRSHSEIVEEVKIPMARRLGINSIGSTFNSYFNFYDATFIPFTNSDAAIAMLKHLDVNENSPYQYIKLKRYLNGGKTETILYKLIYSNEGLYTYPLNLLERNETTEYSVNRNNNRFLTSDYYEDAIIRSIETNTELKEITNLEEFKKLREASRVPVYKSAYVNEAFNDVQALMKLVGDKHGGATQFMEAAGNWIKNPDGNAYTVITSESPVIISMFPKGSNIVQHINIGDVIVPIVITRYDGNKLNTLLLKKLRPELVKADNKISVPKEAKVAFNKVNGRLANTNWYAISRYTEKQESEELEEYKADLKAKQEAQKITLSAYGSVNVDAEYVSRTLYNDISKKVKETNGNIYLDPMGNEFVRNINKLQANSTKDEIMVQTYISAEKYYKAKSEEMVQRLKNYKVKSFDKNGNSTFAVNDEALYEYLKEHPSEVLELERFLLEAVNFGANIKPITQLDVASTDKRVLKNIVAIREAITNVVDTDILRSALKMRYEILGKFKSTEVLQDADLDFIAQTTQFGDMNAVTLHIGDIIETSDRQMAGVLKQTISDYNKATRVAANEAVKKFREQFKEINDMPGGDVLNDIILPDGTFIKPYTEKFIEDKKVHEDAVAKAKEDYGVDSAQYIRAALERNKWKAKNIEQAMLADFYNDYNNITQKVVDKDINGYRDYMALVHELYDGSEDDTPLKELARKSKINRKIARLLSKRDAVKEFVDAKKVLDAKYYKYDTTDNFKATLTKYKNVLAKYDNSNTFVSIDDKLTIPEYKEAYDWMQTNTAYIVDEESKKIINDAFKLLKNKGRDTTTQDKIKDILENSNAYDEYGRLDARKLTDSEIKEIKKLSDSNEDFLIKEIPTDLPVYKDSYFNLFGPKSPTNPAKITLIHKINALLRVGVDDATGSISSKKLFDTLSFEQLKELAGYYQELRNIPEGKRTKQERKILKDNIEFENNTAAFNREWAYAVQEFHTKGNIQKYKVWLDIFVKRDATTGIYVVDGNGKFVPNTQIFGYAKPKNDAYIDEEKTKAKKLIAEHVEYIPNDYYLAAAEAHKGDAAWFERNHNYNPRTRKYEPLSIWTDMHIKPGGEIKAEYNHIPMASYSERNVKPEYLNPKYRTYGLQYNNTTGEYNNRNHLNEKAKAMLDLLQGTLATYSSTQGMKRFVEQGFLPRKAIQKTGWKFYAKQAAGVFGLEWRNINEGKYADIADYAHDVEPDFNMLSLLKQKGSKKTIRYPEKGRLESDEEYQATKDKIDKQNEAIDAENLRLDNEILDRNWEKVFEAFIIKAVDMKARQTSKTSLYLLQEAMRQQQTIALSTYSKTPKEDYINSTDKQKAYHTIDRTKALKALDHHIHKFVYGQYKKESKFNNLSNLLQNITSSKYMIFNVPGGVANVLTGTNNIMGEAFAGEYFNISQYNAANKRYWGNSLSSIADSYSDTTDNLTVGMIKLMNVVNPDEVTERNFDEGAVKGTRIIRNTLYGFQTGGEHYMQNTVMLAMLQSHRVFRDSTGNYTIGSFHDYTRRVEIETLLAMIQNDPDLEDAYADYKKSIRNDAKKARQYATYKKDVVGEFIETYAKGRRKEFNSKRTQALAKAKVEFEKLPVLDNQFELKEGLAVAKEGSNVTDDMIGEFSQKVIAVNKRIHGVYDKLGAARLEREWYGNLIMQYHKHLMTGIKKRFATQGTYNEMRGTIERGSYISAFDLLTYDIQQLKEDIKEDKAKGDNNYTAMKSVLAYAVASFETVIHIKENYDNLTLSEQNNVRRALADLLSVTASILATIALYAIFDDDDVEDDVLLSGLIYILDRFASESNMYTPWGAVGEFKTLWSSPIAASNGSIDLLKGVMIIAKMLTDGDYNPYYTTGSHKGEHKLWFLLKRNIPIVRVIERILDMPDNNRYYRLNKNVIEVIPVKDIANIINPD
jgi:hypothetical protein